MFSNIFKITYFVLFIAAVFVRKRFTAVNKEKGFVVDNKTRTDMVFLTFSGIGMIIPVIYVFSSWFDFADFYLPDWLRWLGVILFVLSIWLLYRSHDDLGKNWTPTLAIQKDHSLITNGIYKYIRHPMYAAHLLWAVAQIFILPNWIAGFSFIIVMLPHYLSRVKKEEAMLIEQFGDDYTDYMKGTGRIFPKF